MNENALRDEMCRVGHSLFERGYVHATAGNISVRLDDGFLITPTDACLGHLDPMRLARIDAQGQPIGGDRASKTLALHRRIYAADAQARCVIHSHSTHLVALTLQGVWSDDDILPPITPYFVIKVGHLPLIPYHSPGDAQVGEFVAQRIVAMAARGTPIRAVMLDRLGPNVWHRSPAQASAVLEELEETARLWLMCSPKPSPLDEAQIEALRQLFGALSGDVADRVAEGAQTLPTGVKGDLGDRHFGVAQKRGCAFNPPRQLIAVRWGAERLFERACEVGL